MNGIRQAIGFSLVELLFVMAIALTVALPSLGNFVEANERRSFVTALVGIFNQARSSSIQGQVSVTLCPLDNESRCSNDWMRPITVFRDPKRRRRLDDPADIIQILPPPSRGTLTANSANRPYFGFRPTGMAQSAIGNLIWCPADRNPKKAVQLRINMGGRLQHARDQDGDGIVEDADGHAIACH